MRKQRIRLGVIGAGIAAKKLHLPALRKLSDFYEITAVTSGHIEGAEEFSQMLDNKAQVFNNYHHLIVSGMIDAVDVAVPPQFNFDIVQDALRNGIHVICEKPIAENTMSAKKILKLARAYDKVFVLAESQRYDPELKHISELIRIGKIGKPSLFDWNVIVNFRESNEYVKTSWRKAPKHIGGFLSDGGVHHMAVLREIFGEVEEVSAMVTKVNGQIGGEDTMTLSMQFKSGMIGNYSVSYGLRAPAHKSLKIYGTSGKMRVTPREIEVIKENEEIEKYPAQIVNLFEEEFKEFYRAVAENASVKTGTPESALIDLAIIEAGVRSSKLGCVVKIDELLE